MFPSHDPEITESITIAHEEPKSYHYTNENNMLNKIVTGMSAKEFKLQHDIPTNVTSIRPYLTEAQREQLEYLQKIDCGLVLSIPDYEQRKQKLEWLFNKKYLA